jgi:hypothetical protein
VHQVLGGHLVQIGHTRNKTRSTKRISKIDACTTMHVCSSARIVPTAQFPAACDVPAKKAWASLLDNGTGCQDIRPSDISSFATSGLPGRSFGDSIN